MPLAYWSNQARNRPLRRAIWTSFGFGFAAGLPVVAIAATFASLLETTGNAYWSSATQSFIVAAIPEELAKFLIVLFFSLRHEGLARPLDAVILSTSVALGFAAIENLFYVAGASSNWSQVATMRAFSAVPMHAAFGVVMGYFAALNLEAIKRGAWPGTPMLLAPIFMHGIYDYPLLLSTIVCSGRLNPANAIECGKAGLAFIVLVVLFLGLAVVAYRNIAGTKSSTAK